MAERAESATAPEKFQEATWWSPLTERMWCGQMLLNQSVDRLSRTPGTTPRCIRSVVLAMLSARSMDRSEGTSGTLDADCLQWKAILLLFGKHKVCTKTASFENGLSQSPRGSGTASGTRNAICPHLLTCKQQRRTIFKQCSTEELVTR